MSLFPASPLARPILLCGLAVSLTAPALAQKTSAKTSAKSADRPAVPAPRVYEQYEVQIQPEYAEGQYALQQYLLTKVQRPPTVQSGQVRGLVQISATVQPDGRLTDAFVLRGLSAECNAEALRLVKAMPRWRPARRSNEAVAARVLLPVMFEPAPKPQRSVTVKGNSEAVELSGLGDPVVVEVVENKVYTYVEQMPVFPGGQEGLISYIQASLRYPAEAVEKKVEGRVFVKFTVEPSGRAINPEIIKGLGAGCDEEVLRVIRALPPFEPGKQNGRTVSVSYTVPVTFSLQTTPGAPGVAIPPVPSLPKPEDKVYTYVEQMPRLAGTTDATIASALQAAVVLPKEVAQGTTEGRVYVSFVVGREGQVEEARVVRSLSPACDAAALAAVAKLPRLEPGRQNGQAVRVQTTQLVQLYSPTHVFEPREAATQATFAGGGMALRQYFTTKLREPKVLAKENLRGAVEVRFVVLPDGKIGAAEVVRPLCRSCDEEALRLVRSMPTWTPAHDASGQAIAVRQSVIIPMPAPELSRKPGTIQD
ncbi:TonB family protein [Hymenobacter metallilatus]|uniref:TonB family protein n=1 Tax=Hymenobacter metallilatus TaxID=2493666 RepID=A0A3R9LY49_9BACT|nr:TonB family protein [Hymenobacter metallilatus]RSK31080.1 TonB family protein [Hymenobacter metallilatus]